MAQAQQLVVKPLPSALSESLLSSAKTVDFQLNQDEAIPDLSELFAKTPPGGEYSWQVSETGRDRNLWHLIILL